MAYTGEPREIEALDRFGRQVRSQFKDWVEELILYGSRARGKAGPASDWDILAIVTRKDPDLESALCDLAFEYLLSDRIDLSVKWMTRSQRDRQLELGVGFIRNVMRDGRSLWMPITASSSSAS